MHLLIPLFTPSRLVWREYPLGFFDWNRASSISNWQDYDRASVSGFVFWSCSSFLRLFLIYSSSVISLRSASGHFVTASTTLYCMPGIWKTIGIYFVKHVFLLFTSQCLMMDTTHKAMLAAAFYCSHPFPLPLWLKLEKVLCTTLSPNLFSERPSVGELVGFPPTLRPS
ncbi:hypothetical protein P8452_15798 [Trifolium repens]|nr:hypothetical protein P8452_15798 [Trifolium repens]